MPSCIIPYPYYYPDDAVSARHITDFAEGLCQHGWDVSVFAGNRYHAKKGKISPARETRNGVGIIRSWYPPFPNSKNIGRLLNCLCLAFIWGIKLLTAKTDVVIFGTNPPFIYFMLPVLAFFRPHLRLALWAFDLYPEAVFADGIKVPAIIKKALCWWAGISYRRVGLLVDIGSCMRRRLAAYNPKARHETIAPWALREPEYIEQPDVEMRYELFGDARLALLYSGTIGKAHQFEEFICLARGLRKRGASVALCFAGRGNCSQSLQDMAAPEDTNITFAGFIKEEKLSLRLASADMHLISLKQGWEGVSVPSKFFGSLAAGRPLLYAGTPDSSIAKLIQEYNLGFIVEMSNIDQIINILEDLANDKNKLLLMQKRIFEYYHASFSKRMQLQKWDAVLRNYIGEGKRKFEG